MNFKKNAGVGKSRLDFGKSVSSDVDSDNSGRSVSPENKPEKTIEKRKARSDNSDDEEFTIPDRRLLIPAHGTRFDGTLAGEVLTRYSLKKKAKFDGGFLAAEPTPEQLKQTGKWSVFAKMGDKPEDHKWINLDETYTSKSGERQIRVLQLGHKLAAAKWFQVGSKTHMKGRLKEVDESQKRKGRSDSDIVEKRKNIVENYDMLKKEGKNIKEMEDRKVINSSFNFRFEHYSYNASHGGDGYGYGSGNKKGKT